MKFPCVEKSLVYTYIGVPPNHLHPLYSAETRRENDVKAL